MIYNYLESDWWLSDLSVNSISCSDDSCMNGACNAVLEFDIELWDDESCCNFFSYSFCVEKLRIRYCHKRKLPSDLFYLKHQQYLWRWISWWLYPKMFMMRYYPTEPIDKPCRRVCSSWSKQLAWRVLYLSCFFRYFFSWMACLMLLESG